MYRLNSDHNRHSFDRFSDDLCENILQYLSFTDKIRFECVSKRWTRTVLSSQHVLHIDDNIALITSEYQINSTHNQLPAIKLLSYYSNQINPFNNVTIIERLLQKCPQINHVIVSMNFLSQTVISFEQLLRIIGDNCVRLQSFKFTKRAFYNIHENAWKYFGQKCGETLRSIDANDWHGFSYKCLLSHCPNLLRIRNIGLTQLVDDNTGKVMAPQLREITGVYECERIDLMDIFVNCYKNTIRILELRNYGKDCRIFMWQLSRLTNLERLSLFMPSIEISQFASKFKILAVNCDKLKVLSLELYETAEISEFYDCAQLSYIELFKSINRFNRLKYLNLDIRESINRRHQQCCNEISANLINNCSQLTHLILKGNGFSCDKYFADTHQYLPLIKVINIQCYA